MEELSTISGFIDSLGHYQKFMEDLLSLLLGLSLLNDFDILIKKFQAFYYACRPPKFE